MKTVASRLALQSAIKMLSFYLSPDNRFPYIHMRTSEESLVLCATDSLGYTEVEVPASISEAGQCMIGEKVDRVLANLTCSDVSLTIKEDSSTLMIGGDKGAKIRLQTVVGQPVERDAIHSKLETVPFCVGITLDHSELSHLVKLSEMFPNIGGSKQTWIVLNIDAKKFEVIGETQTSDEGGVENYPMNVIATDGEENATLVINTNFFRIPLQNCGQSVYIRASKNRRDPVLISDPENPSWFNMVSQIIRSGETE